MVITPSIDDFLPCQFDLVDSAAELLQKPFRAAMHVRPIQTLARGMDKLGLSRDDPGRMETMYTRGSPHGILSSLKEGEIGEAFDQVLPAFVKTVMGMPLLWAADYSWQAAAGLGLLLAKVAGAGLKGLRNLLSSGDQQSMQRVAQAITHPEVVNHLRRYGRPNDFSTLRKAAADPRFQHTVRRALGAR